MIIRDKRAHPIHVEMAAVLLTLVMAKLELIRALIGLPFASSDAVEG